MHASPSGLPAILTIVAFRGNVPRPRCLRSRRPEHTAEPGYHTNGTRRRRTRFWYSVYPARSLARRRSSSRSRHIRNGIMAAIGTRPQYEPRASGVPTRYSDPLAYIGWRTIAYGPVEMTV